VAITFKEKTRRNRNRSCKI